MIPQDGLKMGKQISKNGEFCAVYKNFGGMDLRRVKSDKSDKISFEYTENMYRDYEGDFQHSVESIPGFRRLAALGQSINSIFMQRCSESEEYLVVHAGNGIYRFNINERDNIGSLKSIFTVKNGKSHAFQKGSTLFIFDGEHIIKISESGAAAILGDSDEAVYVPTTFKDGNRFEQRNLLTRRFKESYVIDEHDKHYRETKGLKYELKDDGTCTVIGIDLSVKGAVYIPKYAELGKKRYKILGIADNAFSGNASISAVYIADGLTYIGKLAFYQCYSLSTVYCPSSIELIDNGAFLDCIMLTEVFIGKNLKRIGMLPFSGAFSLEGISFEADTTSVSAIENIEDLDSYEKTYSVQRPDNHYSVRIFTPYESIDNVYLNEKELIFDIEAENAFSEARLLFSLPAYSPPEGKSIVLYGTAALGKYNTYDEGTDFAARSEGDENVIAECTCSALFDGRIFTAGNPKYPNTVFYTLSAKNEQNDSIYFGALSYFDDGMSAYKTVSLASASDALAVLKASDDGGGGIFYHEAKDGGDFLQRVYPVSNIHTGINVIGNSISFFDEIFFLSDIGACALKKSNAGNRSASCRSEKINPLLLKNKDLSEAHITSWLGYIVIQIGKEIYLADARPSFSDSSEEYDWYYLNEIGTYSDGKAKLRYSEFAPEGYYRYPELDTEISGSVYLSVGSSYGEIYYVKDSADESKRYTVYMTGEITGGEFSPACSVFSDGRLLLFGTESGDLCIFNTDKRGAIPKSGGASSDFDDAYKAVMGNRIHRDFYDFAGRRVSYVALTKADDVDIPYMKKSTVGNSIALKLGNIGGINTVTDIIADGSCISSAEGLCGGITDFSDIDFSSFSFEGTNQSDVCISGAPKNWREQQIRISSSDFRAPISISEISCRYKIKGRLTRK